MNATMKGAKLKETHTHFILSFVFFLPLIYIFQPSPTPTPGRSLAYNPENPARTADTDDHASWRRVYKPVLVYISFINCSIHALSQSISQASSQSASQPPVSSLASLLVGWLASLPVILLVTVLVQPTKTLAPDKNKTTNPSSAHNGSAETPEALTHSEDDACLHCVACADYQNAK